jgi:hypothetical protein
VIWNSTEVKTGVRKGDGSAEKVEEKDFTYSSGAKAEVTAFSKAIEAGKLNTLQTPAEALKDLEILQRLLESGAEGTAGKKIVA